MFGPTAYGEDAAAVAAGIRSSGANTLLFFTSLYYGYRLIQPRYPERGIYSLEADRVYYDPDLSLYDDCRIKPSRSLDFPDLDHVALLTDACHQQGIEFSALMPVCAAARFAQEFPDLAVENLYGAKDRLFLCYNNPDVRQYRLAMIQDLVGRYEVDGLMLDKIPQTMLEARAQNGFFDPPLRTVGSFCFCEHCIKRASRSGLDLKEVQSRCREIATRSLRMPPHLIELQAEQLSGDTEIPLLLLEEPLVYQMLQFRFETATEWVGELREEARKIRPGIPVEAAFVPPTHVGHDATSPRSWLTVQSYQKYSGVLDGILCVVHFTPEIVRFETERAVAASEGKVPVTTSMRLYGATSPEQVPILAEAALAGGSTGVSFLGYDVTTDKLLSALSQWVEGRRVA
jgi:hypothetical protein